ncbi:MAG: HlyD family efflux transporter periplasmic adaptor subunit [Chloroflexota bacterium]
MKRWWIWLVGLLIVVAVGGGAYAGLQSTRPGEATAPQTPATVTVTRGDVQQSVTAPGYLVSTHETVLGARLAGRLRALHVRPGDTVQAGDVLAEIEIENWQTEITLAEADLAQANLCLAEAAKSRQHQIVQAEQELAAAQARLAQAERDNLDAQAGAELSLAAAQEQLARLIARQPEYDAAVTDARIGLERAQDALERAQAEYQKALDRTWEPPAVRDAYARALQEVQWQHESAQARYDQALAGQEVYRHDLTLQQMAVEQAGAELARLEQGIDPLLALEVQRARQALDWLNEGGDALLESDVEQAQLALDRLRAQAADARIVAPGSGVVLEVMARPGDALAEGMALILMTSPAAVEARTTVIEEDLPLVQVGQTVDLFFDARPDVTVQGHVTRIVPRREAASDRPLYPVYITPDELPEGLAPGMTVDVSIVTASRSDVLRLPRTLVRARADGTAEVQVWAGGEAETRTVRVGLRGDIYVEIVDGLRQGEEVVGQ